MDYWIVEDSRTSARLAHFLSIEKSMHVVNEHTGETGVQRAIQGLSEGLSAALLTDGGAPGISDPGAIVADSCHIAGIAVTAIPGPSAVVTALAASGFYAQRFAFLGFLPRKAGAMRSELEPFRDSPFTLVLFESPHRLNALLEACCSVLGERRYALCRELTKAFEQVYRGKLPQIPAEDSVKRKGEFTIVIEGKRRGNPTQADTIGCRIEGIEAS